MLCNFYHISKPDNRDFSSTHIYHLGAYKSELNNLVLEVGEWWNPSDSISYINRLGLHHVAVIPVDRNSSLHSSPYHHQYYFGPYTFDDAIRLIFTGGLTDSIGTWSGPGDRVGMFCVNHQGNVIFHFYGS